MVALVDNNGSDSDFPAYTVQSGEPDNPITVRNFPCERPVFDMRSVSTPGNTMSVIVYAKSYWVIQGFEIIGGMVWLDYGPGANLTHDITIRRNNIHDVTAPGGINPGLIYIGRGGNPGGGPYNIYIMENKLHKIFDEDYPGIWDGIRDYIHYGAVTVQSRENYLGMEGGGNGFIQITGNEIFECPMALFFKNPMEGPIIVSHNVIHDVDIMGPFNASNISFVRNLVYDVDTGWFAGTDDDPAEIIPICGQDHVVEYNTFVGLDSIIEMGAGHGHSINNNIFFGLTGSASSTQWGTPAYLAQNRTLYDSVDPADSVLQDITSDNNCFISPHEEFLFVRRIVNVAEVGFNNPVTDFWTPIEAQAMFGYDLNSVFIQEDSEDAIFVNPAEHDYQLLNPGVCPGMGYLAE
jgi:hypothetical protein